jgi:DNA-binding CsgD family transcriptional regulator
MALYRSKHVDIDRLRNANTAFLMGFWSALQGPAEIPEWSSEFLGRLDRCLDRVCLIEASSDDPLGYRFVHWGPRMVRDNGFNYCGYRLADMPDPLPVKQKIGQDWATTARSRMPQLFRVEMRVGQTEYFYNRILLPFASPGGTPLLMLFSELMSREPFDRLTTAQFRVAELVSKGLPNKRVAFELGISEGTVRVHMKQIMRRLHVRNRTQLALLMSGSLPIGVLAD